MHALMSELKNTIIVGICHNIVPSLATSPLSLKQGLNVFGGAGHAAVQSKLQQLHDRKGMKTMDARELTQ